MAPLASVTVDARFRGPPDSGNGGYVAGLLAAFLAEPAEVRLVRPPPLGRPLDVRRLDDDGLELADGAATLATVRPAAVDPEVPDAPPYAAAEVAARAYAGHVAHAAPGCFVCGPGRSPGDGLGIFPGPAELGGPAGAGVLAPWRPDPSLAGTRGRVRPEFLWAALDCPGYFAFASPGQPMLLGTLAARVDGEVRVGEPCVVAGWSLGASGRKHRAATALYGGDGRCVARALAVWIALR
jgi:hypothetical protein